MKLRIEETAFALLLSEKYLFKSKDILTTGNSKIKILKNYDRENKNKSKAWKKILRKLNVKLKTGMLVKLIK